MEWTTYSNFGLKTGWSSYGKTYYVTISSWTSGERSMVNDDMQQEYAHQVIKLAKQELESDSELNALIDKCSTHVSNLPKESENKLFNDFVWNFHAWVNKYMVATEEIELEKAGKAVKVKGASDAG